MSDIVHIVKCNVLNSIQHQEIGALKDRIIQLEEELIDAKGKYAALVADVVLYEDIGERIKRLEEAGDRLQMLIEEQGWWESVPQEMWRKAKDAK